MDLFESLGSGRSFTAAIFLTLSAWITSIRARRRVKKALGRKATDMELASLNTWMQVEEKNSSAGRAVLYIHGEAKQFRVLYPAGSTCFFPWFSCKAPSGASENSPAWSAPGPKHAPLLRVIGWSQRNAGLQEMSSGVRLQPDG
jgi:hypothetical protein